MTDREKHIRNLSYMMDSMPDDACGDWRDSLAFAISSIKTDLKYDLMCEGEEIYTKADMVAMLTEIQLEIEEKEYLDGEEPINITQDYIDEVKSWEYGKKDCYKIIQQKIDKLKEGSK